MRRRLKWLWGIWHHLDAFRGFTEVAIFAVSLIGGAAIVISAGARMLGVVGDLWFLAITGMATAVAVVPWFVLAPRLSRRSKSVPQAAPDNSIVLLEPIDGAEVRRVFMVRGFADTFESNVVIEDQRPDRTWEVIAITSGGGMGALGEFSIGVSLDPGKHRFRVGDYSAKDNEWSGVEIEIVVEKAEPQSIEYQGIQWVHNGYRRDSSPTVRPECPDHSVRLFYREGVSRVIPVREISDDDEIGPYSTLVCVNADGHDIRLTSGLPQVRFGDLAATAEERIASKVQRH